MPSKGHSSAQFVATARPENRPWMHAAKLAREPPMPDAHRDQIPRDISDRSPQRGRHAALVATDPAGGSPTLPGLGTLTSTFENNPSSPPLPTGSSPLPGRQLRKVLPSPGRDAGSTALNAAALQTVHRHGGRSPPADMASPRVYNGQILWQRRPAQLDGLPSTDISYGGDRMGHGLNQTSSDMRRMLRQSPRAQTAASTTSIAPPGTGMSSTASLSTAAAGRMVGAPAEPAATYLAGATEAAAGLPLTAFPREAAVPSSRTEAMATASRLRRGLEALGEIGDSSEETAMELSLWDAALVEVVRQVEVHCQERGRLLEAIRARHVTLFDQLLTRRQAEIEELARQHAEKMKSAVDAASRTGKVALLFQRAEDARVRRWQEGEDQLRRHG